MKNVFVIMIFIQFMSCLSNTPISIIDNLQIGLKIAKEKKMKIFIIFDFLGNPTTRVDDFLEDNKTAKLLKHHVVIRLMCDDKRMLNDSVSIGRINSNFQEAISGKYYQPMFCFLDENGKRISPCFGYAKKEELIKFIEDYIE